MLFIQLKINRLAQYYFASMCLVFKDHNGNFLLYLIQKQLVSSSFHS